MRETEIKRRNRKLSPEAYRWPVSTRLSDEQLDLFERIVSSERLTRCAALRRIFDLGADAILKKL